MFDKNAIITKEKAQSLDLYINSHEPHILSSSEELGKTIGLKRIEQFKTLNLLLFNLRFCEKIDLSLHVQERLLELKGITSIRLGTRLYVLLWTNYLPKNTLSKKLGKRT